MKHPKLLTRSLTILMLSGSLLLPIAHANPDADPLGQMLQQKQNNQPDHDGLDALIRSKSTAAPAPIANAPTAPNKATPSPQTRRTPPPAAENPAAGDSTPIAKRDADDLLSSAMGFLGVAYRFGGTSPTGFDCSGFMQYIFRKTFAVNLPRTSAEQAQIGMPVNRADLQPGDMVFFRTAGSRISHVGMYVGNDRFIHAPRTGKNIEITSLSSKYWSSKYATARRVKRNNAQQFIKQ